jgi:hypothetical protein
MGVVMILRGDDKVIVAAATGRKLKKLTTVMTESAFKAFVLC